MCCQSMAIHLLVSFTCLLRVPLPTPFHFPSCIVCSPGINILNSFCRRLSAPTRLQDSLRMEIITYERSTSCKERPASFSHDQETLLCQPVWVALVKNCRFCPDFARARTAVGAPSIKTRVISGTGTFCYTCPNKVAPPEYQHE